MGNKGGLEGVSRGPKKSNACTKGVSRGPKKSNACNVGCDRQGHQLAIIPWREVDSPPKFSRDPKGRGASAVARIAKRTWSPMPASTTASPLAAKSPLLAPLLAVKFPPPIAIPSLLTADSNPLVADSPPPAASCPPSVANSPAMHGPKPTR
eukprot:1193454-Prorocentrum_minimum.AAC.2